MSGYLMLIISQIMLGSIAVFARWAHLPAEIIVFFRCFIGMSAIGAAIFFSTPIRPYLKPNRTLFLLVATGVFMALNWYFFFRAVLSTDIPSAILLYNLAPLFVMLSAAAFLAEIPTVRQVFCLAVSVVGMTMILGREGLRIESGAPFAILAGALYAQVTVIGRYLKGVPAPVVTFFQTSVGAVIFGISGFPRLTALSISPSQWGILLAIGIFHTAVPYLMYFKALQTVRATVAGIAQYLYTLSTILFSALFFRESVNASTLAGGSLILAASYVALKHPGKTRIAFKRTPRVAA